MIPNIRIEDFDYELPKEQIALYPMANRSDSRLLVADKESGLLKHDKFKNILNYLPENSELFVNSTKVICARILANKVSGGRAEIFLIEPLSPSTDPQITLNSTEATVWKCLIGGKRIYTGTELICNIDNSDIELKCEILKKESNTAEVKISFSPNTYKFSQILEKIGKIPLPPYIKRETEDKDADSYQTVYADKEGSVAAPTAGLHFTDDILNSIKNKNININELILHVGPGTFQPVEVDTIDKHIMHSERMFVSFNTIERLYNALESKKNIIAVGTTSLRTLESIYNLGVKLTLDNDLKINSDENWFGQWEPYKLVDHKVSPAQAVGSIYSYMSEKGIDMISGRTQLFITPSYEIKTANMLITNFHLPQSTLLLLVSAFIGDVMRQCIYSQALNNNYRFLSYGDSSLLIRNIL